MIVHASGLGEIMAPTKKAGELSAGAKSFVKKRFKEALFGYRESFDSKYTKKGILVEEESIALYNRVNFTDCVKNTERRKTELLTGEADIINGDTVIDIKSSWSLMTFPIFPADAADAGYEWQLRAYMYLWDLPKAELAFCMVSTPEHLIGFEDRAVHIVDHIPEEMRLTALAFERDAGKESEMIARIKLAQAYYQQLEDEYLGIDGADVHPA